MTKHQIRLRRKGFSSQRIEKHKNYGQLLDQHRRTSKIRVFNYTLGLLILGSVVGLIYYTMGRLESLPAAGPNNQKQDELIEQIDPIVNTRRIAPKPTGGLASYYQYMEEHLEYPPRALDQGIEGIVYVAFVVEPDGTLSEVRILKGLGYGCDENAMKLIIEGPPWIPGMKGQAIVRAPMVMPVTFKIEQKIHPLDSSG